LEYEISVNGRLRHVTVRRLDGDGDGDGRFVVAMDGHEWTVDAARVDANTLSLLIDDRSRDLIPLKPDSTSPFGGSGSSRTSSHEITFGADLASGGFSVRVGDTPVAVSFNARRQRRPRDAGSDTGSGPQRLVAPMPGKIVRVLVKIGDPVVARQPLVVIEAMKMENELRAASGGRVAEIHVQEGQSVDAGALLAVIHR